MKKVTHCIVYRLHKDKSPTVIDCYSEKEQNEQLSKIIKEGYKNAYKASPEHAIKVLNDYGKLFEPKPLSQQERWINWAFR
jgi:hypothetical protein